MTNHPETPAWVRNVKVGDKLVATGLVSKVAYWEGSDEPVEPEPPLEKGSIHTVQDIDVLPFRERVYFWVGEMVTATNRNYRAWRHFRPLSKRSTETGMSILTSILDSASVRTGGGVS